MNAAVAAFAKRSFLVTGYYARRLRSDSFPGVAILCYHGVTGDGPADPRMNFMNLHVRANDLEAHCRLLRDTCHPISLEDWRRARAGGPPLPSRPVLLTFDEAYRPLLTLAVPVLRRYAVPAVVFVWSDPVEQRRLAWYDAVARGLGEPEVERLKSVSYEEWRRVSERQAQPAEGGDPCAPVSVAETDYTPETVKLVEESGFDFGFTTRPGFATPDEPALEHSRFLMLRGVSAAELEHRLAHSWRR
jgi:hypothetical protein